MREREGDDSGLVLPAIAVVVLAFVVVLAGLTQIGLSADRSGRVQIAADAAALAGAQALAASRVPATPSQQPPSAAATGRQIDDSATAYARRNLGGLPRSGVTVRVSGDEVEVQIVDTQPLPFQPLDGARRPRNTASATAEAITDCTPGATPEAEPTCDVRARLVD